MVKIPKGCLDDRWSNCETRDSLIIDMRMAEVEALRREVQRLRDQIAVLMSIPKKAIHAE